VVARGERAGVARGAERGERAVGLVLCNLHPGEPQARHQHQISILGVLSYGAELARGVIELGLIHIDPRGEQPALIGVR